MLPCRLTGRLVVLGTILLGTVVSGRRGGEVVVVDRGRKILTGAGGGGRGGGEEGANTGLNVNPRLCSELGRGDRLWRTGERAWWGLGLDGEIEGGGVDEGPWVTYFVERNTFECGEE